MIKAKTKKLWWERIKFDLPLNLKTTDIDILEDYSSSYKLLWLSFL